MSGACFRIWDACPSKPDATDGGHPFVFCGRSDGTLMQADAPCQYATTCVNRLYPRIPDGGAVFNCAHIYKVKAPTPADAGVRGI